MQNYACITTGAMEPLALLLLLAHMPCGLAEMKVWTLQGIRSLDTWAASYNGSSAFDGQHHMMMSISAGDELRWPGQKYLRGMSRSLLDEPKRHKKVASLLNDDLLYLVKNDMPSTDPA